MLYSTLSNQMFAPLVLFEMHQFFVAQTDSTDHFLMLLNLFLALLLIDSYEEAMLD